MNLFFETSEPETELIISEPFVLRDQHPEFNAWGTYCAYCGRPWLICPVYENLDDLRYRLEKRCPGCGSASFVRLMGQHDQS